MISTKFLIISAMLAAAAPAAAQQPICPGARAGMRALNASIAVVNEKMSDLQTGMVTERQNVRAANAALVAAEAAVAPAQKAVDDAQAAYDTQAAKVEQAQDDFNTKSTAWNTIVNNCHNNTGTEPCRSEISNAYAAMNLAGLKLGRARTKLATLLTALTNAKAALARAKAAVQAAKAALAAAKAHELAQLAVLQGAVDTAMAKERAASAAYQKILSDCNGSSAALHSLLTAERVLFGRVHRASNDAWLQAALE